MLITAAATSASTQNGIRPIDLRRDLRVVADLIGDAFEKELDASGRASLQEMRTLARLGIILPVLLPNSSGSGGFLHGFVWEEDGEVVGNVTLQQLRNDASRWMIANVAVREDYRGRGIGHALMDSALERIRHSGGSWAILQVYRKNDVARHLYDELDFDPIVAETHLRNVQVAPALDKELPADLQLAEFGDSDWRGANQLIRRSVPELARWWQPNRKKDFRRNSDHPFKRKCGRWLGQGHRLRLGVYRAGELKGILDLTHHPRSEQEIDLLLHPDVQQDWTEPLLVHGVNLLHDYAQQPIKASLFDYQHEAITILADLGFREIGTLITMRKRIIALSERYT